MASLRHLVCFLSVLFLFISLSLSSSIKNYHTDSHINYNNKRNNFNKFIRGELLFRGGGHTTGDEESCSPKKGDNNVAHVSAQLQFENDENGKKSESIACDSYNSCPGKTTCCCTYTYGPYCYTWACCPFESGVCCADDPSQCCPHTHPICNTQNRTCSKKDHKASSVKAAKQTTPKYEANLDPTK